MYYKHLQLLFFQNLNKISSCTVTDLQSPYCIHNWKMAAKKGIIPLSDQQYHAWRKHKQL